MTWLCVTGCFWTFGMLRSDSAGTQVNYCCFAWAETWLTWFLTTMKLGEPIPAHSNLTAVMVSCCLSIRVPGFKIYSTVSCLTRKRWLVNGIDSCKLVLYWVYWIYTLVHIFFFIICHKWSSIFMSFFTLIQLSYIWLFSLLPLCPPSHHRNSSFCHLTNYVSELLTLLWLFGQLRRINHYLRLRIHAPLVNLLQDTHLTEIKI